MTLGKLDSYQDTFMVVNFPEIEGGIDRISLNIPMDEEAFWKFCRQNADLRIERLKDQTITIMPPTGSETGIRNSELMTELALWNRKERLGYAFDSSTGFTLSDSSMLSPDASWIAKDRWEALSKEEQKKFAPICPNFVIELKSPSDKIADLKEKMQDWLANGCQLAWLIHPETEEVFIYRKEEEVEKVTGFEQKLSGGEVLPGFELNLALLKES